MNFFFIRTFCYDLITLRLHKQYLFILFHNEFFAYAILSKTVTYVLFIVLYGLESEKLILVQFRRMLMENFDFITTSVN